MNNFENEFIKIMTIINSPSSSKTERDSAESVLKGTAQNNFTQFSIFLSSFILQENQNKSYRVYSGSLLSNIIKGTYILGIGWYEINPQERLTIKDNLLMGLGISDMILVKQCAKSIASICAKEFPNNENLNIINQLSNIACDINQQEVFRLSAMITLRMILEDVNSSDIENSLIVIAGSIYENLNSNNKELQKESLVTLQHSIKGFGNQMNNSDISENIFKMIYQGYSIGDFDMKLTALKCLDEFSACYYDNEILYKEIKEIYDITSNVISKSSDDNMIIQAYEFWINIASNEKKIIKHNLDKNRGYITLCQNNLFDFCIMTLLNTSKDYFLDIDNNLMPYKSVIILLEKIAGCCSEEFIHLVNNKAMELLNNKSNEINIYIGILLFNTIMKSIHFDTVGKLIEINIGNMLDILQNSPSVLIKRAVADYVIYVSEIFLIKFDDNQRKYLMRMIYDLINKENDKHTIIRLIYSAHFAFKFYGTNSKFKFIYIIFIIFSGIINDLRDFFMESLKDMLLKIEIYDSQTNIQYWASVTLGTIIENSPSENNIKLQEFLHQMLLAMETAYTF